MMSNLDLAVAVAQGNMGALSLCAQLLRLERNDVLTTMLRLGITGPRVWLAFKDLGDQSIERLIENVESADIVERLTALGYAPEVQL